MRLATMALTVVTLSGCSLALVREPPSGDGPVPRGSCTRSIIAPALDGWMGVMSGAFGFVIMFDETSSSDYVSEEAVALGLMGAGGLLGYSAVRGFGSTSECRRRNTLSEEALADYLRLQAGHHGATIQAQADGSTVHAQPPAQRL